MWLGAVGGCAGGRVWLVGGSSERRDQRCIRRLHAVLVVLLRVLLVLQDLAQPADVCLQLLHTGTP